MTEKPFIQGLLKGLLNLGKAKAEPVKVGTPIGVPSTQTMVASKEPKPKSEAYLNRKKGRPSGGAWHIPKVIEYLADKGEVTPGDMARDLGLPKSTLIYNLNRIMEFKESMANDYHYYHLGKHLAGRGLERVGGGKYVRYRLVENPPSNRAAGAE